jgi:hypothetical protein
MKTSRILIVLLVGMLLLPAVSFGASWTATALMTGGAVTDNTTSTIFKIPTGSGGMTILLPTLTSSTVAIQVANSRTGTFVDFYYLAGAAAAPAKWVTTGGTGDIVVDLPEGISNWEYAKLVCGTAQAANRTFTIKGN